MNAISPTLYYVYDPMCAWCWGYKPVWDSIRASLSDEVEIQYVLGGLAEDTDQPMPVSMRAQIAEYWRKIESYLGTEFNHDFWKLNEPRRSTYPACRAVVAARAQGAELEMYAAIQRAYYLEAKNPSDNPVLMQLAESIGLDKVKFEQDLTATETHKALLQEINFARSIGGNSFPSLFLVKGTSVIELPVDYQRPEVTLSQVRSIARTS
ncbi:DsbA family protein [Vibrio maritimus]|uniref:DsbA family protein n=1 Tax=Vibrio maritimus TaxID=990268 RepID=UPI001F32721C|nr:DsbA family protein [Vibrio maritimus]